ncbi:MAG: SDR family oxidoreductase, partial [Gemmatimonadota bacterium]
YVARMSNVALVTGGATRVGRAISLGLAEAGYDLVINFRTSGDEALEVEALAREMGRKVVLVEGDVSKGLDVRRCVDAAAERLGRLDLLVNNASLFHATPFRQIEEEEWDEVMAVNVRGPFLAMQAAADMLATAHGSVVNMVDLSALEPWVDFAHHAASKAALLQLTRVMAKTLAPDVRVNAIAPGSVLLPDHYTEAQREASRTRTALGSLGSPEDVVRTVLFLADSPFVTGEVIVVDGGRLLT